MRDTKTTSWIFLSIAMASQNGPASISDITTIADGINHSVPTHIELQSSIKYLINNRMLIIESRKYSLTSLGIDIFNDAKKRSNTIFIIWDLLDAKLSALDN
jgi:predicted transcriptional regulator